MSLEKTMKTIVKSLMVLSVGVGILAFTIVGYQAKRREEFKKKAEPIIQKVVQQYDIDNNKSLDLNEGNRMLDDLGVKTEYTPQNIKYWFMLKDYDYINENVTMRIRGGIRRTVSGWGGLFPTLQTIYEVDDSYTIPLGQLEKIVK